MTRYRPGTYMVMDMEYKKLNIYDTEGLKECMKKEPSFFKGLKTVEVRRCDEELTYFLSILINGSSDLEDLTIENSELLEQVFDIGNSSGNNKLPNLRIMRLCNLPQLNSIYNNNGVKLGNLNKLELFKCGNLKGPLSTALLVQLRSLMIEACDMIEQVVEDNAKEIFCYLSSLDLVNLPKLTKVVSNKALSDLAGKMLTYLRVRGCNQLKYALPLKVDQSLQELQKIDISNCEMLEQVFGDEEETKMGKSNNTFELCKVESLILERLPKFCGLSQDGSTIKWLSVKNVKVVECPMIQKFSLGQIERNLFTNMHVIGDIKDLFYMDELSWYEELKIEDSEELNNYVKIMEELWPSSSFSSLRILEVIQCDQLLSKFLSILVCRPNDLEELTVANCELLEQVFDIKDLAIEDLQVPRILHKLHTMRLCGLHKLNCIWNKDPREIVELGKLVKLEITDCGLRKGPLSTALLGQLAHLESLKIEACEMIERVLEDDTEMQEKSFPNLKYIQLLSLPKLIKFNSGHSNLKFPHLLSLKIEKCPELKAFTTGFLTNQRLIEGTSNPDENMDVCSKLQTLKLVGHKTFEEIWQGKVCNIADYELKEVEVDSFTKLTHIFPSNMLPIVSEKLETLVVRNCSSLSTMFQMNKENDSIKSFQNLQIVRVKGCANLQHLLLPSSCPSLKEFEISDCESLEDIFVDPKVKADDKCFPNLEYIVLENLPTLSSFYLKIFEFPMLQKARIVNCPAFKTYSKEVSAAANNFIPKDSPGSPEELHQLLYDIDLEEDSPFDHVKMTLLPLLAELELSDLPKMQLINKEPLIPVFENLTSLKIIRCASIKKLFPISVAQHLASLKLLTLYKCENMVHVLQGGGGGNSSIRVFQKLETLVLKHLKELTSLCEENVDFGEFPELKIFRLENTQKMKTFVKKSLKTPKLKEVYVTYVNKCWKGDLNNTITYLHGIHEEKGIWKTD